MITQETIYGAICFFFWHKNFHAYSLFISIGGILNDTLRPPVPESCDSEWGSLMEQCWSTEPSQRPSFTDIASRLRAMAAALPQKGWAAAAVRPKYGAPTHRCHWLTCLWPFFFFVQHSSLRLVLLKAVPIWLVKRTLSRVSQQDQRMLAFPICSFFFTHDWLGMWMEKPYKSLEKIASGLLFLHVHIKIKEYCSGCS